MFASTRLQGLVLLLCVGTVACSDAPDALVADVVIIQPPTPAAGPAGPAHCAYESETQRPWRAPTPGAVQAGVARVVLDVPIGTPLAPYGGRLKALGGIPVDDRESPLTTAFVPSVGIQSSPAATALVLQAGDELLVWVKLDLGLSVETLLYDLEARLADAVPGGLAGHVLVTVSHGHSGWGAYHPGQVMSLGADRFRPQVYGRILDGAEAAVRSALASLAPARIGLGIQDGWDPQRRIYDDRRPQNDGLPEDDGGAVGSTRDERLWILRVDNDSGPLAAVVSFGFHGNIAREVNALASIEAGGLVELELQERLGPGVVVMHALSAAGDADATGVSSLPPCEVSPCADFAQMESVGQLAADTALALHASIETSDRVGLSFASRTVALGRDLEIREGALRYAPADAVPDRVVWTADGAIANPIDEFAAPDGAALCGGATPDLPLSPIDGVEDLSPWGTCVDLSLATGILTALFGTQPGGTPFCETVRTVVGGLRLADIPLLTIGADGTQAQSDAEDVLVATLPGEPVSLWARTFRERSPRGPERTLLLGYAQDYVGYLLSAEDWMSGGFEPSINVWGPLEGEFLMEHALALAFDLTADTAPEKRPAVDRVAWTLPTEPDWTPQPGTAPGTIPKELPEGLVVGVGTTPAGAQPNPTIRRVVDTATFVFEGHDPLAETPTVVLEFESPTGFEPVRDTSGRPLDVHAPELLLTYTPDPLTGDGPRRHLYAVQWQAVAPLGSALEDASGVAAGTYRFRVDGSGYSLVSDAFAVVGDGSLTVEVERDGDSASGRVFFEVRGGYRLLRLDGASEGEVSVVGEVSVAGTTVLLGPGGGFILNAPGGGGVVVVDRFGNRGVE